MVEKVNVPILGDKTQKAKIPGFGVVGILLKMEGFHKQV